MKNNINDIINNLIEHWKHIVPLVLLKDNNIDYELIEHWKHIAPLIVLPDNNFDYEAMVTNLDVLLREIRDNYEHPLVGLVDIMSKQIAKYEVIKDSKYKHLPH